ncbi:hypothetical protein V2A60_008726 [Cordyceps javanica]
MPGHEEPQAPRSSSSKTDTPPIGLGSPISPKDDKDFEVLSDGALSDNEKENIKPSAADHERGKVQNGSEVLGKRKALHELDGDNDVDTPTDATPQIPFIEIDLYVDVLDRIDVISSELECLRSMVLRSLTATQEHVIATENEDHGSQMAKRHRSEVKWPKGTDQSSQRE